MEYALTTFPTSEIYRDEERTVYKVVSSLRDRGAIDHAHEIARLYFDHGWGRPQVAQEGFANRWAAADARVWLPLTRADCEITFKLRAVRPAQKILVRVNGVDLFEFTGSQSWNEYVLRVPFSVARTGLNEFVFTTTLLPLDAAHPGDEQIGSTGVFAPVDISVTAAGFDAGRFGEIFVEGRNVIDGRRGYHLVVIDPSSGSVERVERFDTFAHPDESRRLAEFVAELPRGKIVAGAAVDEVSRELQQSAVEALRGLGVESDLRFQFRAAHAFIGVKGAPAGRPVEQVDATFPANVWAGKNVAFNQVAFALGPLSYIAK